MKSFALLLLAPTLTWAHSGHGMGDGWHWHASDTWGYLLMAAVVTFAVWGGRKK